MQHLTLDSQNVFLNFEQIHAQRKTWLWLDRENGVSDLRCPQGIWSKQQGFLKVQRRILCNQRPHNQQGPSSAEGFSRQNLAFETRKAPGQDSNDPDGLWVKLEWSCAPQREVRDIPKRNFHREAREHWLGKEVRRWDHRSSQGAQRGGQPRDRASLEASQGSCAPE